MPRKKAFTRRVLYFASLIFHDAFFLRPFSSHVQAEDIVEDEVRSSRCPDALRWHEGEGLRKLLRMRLAIYEQVAADHDNNSTVGSRLAINGDHLMLHLLERKRHELVHDSGGTFELPRSMCVVLEIEHAKFRLEIHDEKHRDDECTIN